MKISGLQVTVNKSPSGTEVFIQSAPGAETLINTAFHLPADAEIESGAHELTLTKVVDKPLTKEEAKEAAKNLPGQINAV